MFRRCLAFALIMSTLGGAFADEAPLEARVLGSSSQGGMLVKLASPGALSLSDLVRVERDGQTLGEAVVTTVRGDGTVVLVPRFRGEIRSADRLYFARHVQVLADTARSGTAGRAFNVPVDAREAALAARGSAHVVKEIGPLSRDAALIARVERIGRRIVDACPRTGITWTFQVLQSRQVNALTVGMGRIYVTTALLELVDDEQLAGALAHEVAHVCLRHSTRLDDTVDEGRMYVRNAQACAEEAQRIANEPTFSPEMRAYRVRSKMDEAQAWVSRAQSVGKRIDKWKTGDGWDHEYEADHMGLVYMRAAGYRPQGLVDCLQKLADRERKEFFSATTIEGASDHPPMAKRIEIARTVTTSLTTKR